MHKQKKSTSKKASECRRKLLLNNNKKNLVKQFPYSDTIKLIHELEFHQIELKMQNEELKLAKDKAEFTEKKYTELYNFAPSGHLTLTKEGEIIGLNESAVHLLKKDRSHLIKSSFGFFVSIDVEMLGGKIWVENNAGKNGHASGAKFLFTIPVHPMTATNHVDQIPPPDKSTKILSRKLNILIAEDDEFSQMLFIKLVEGFTRKIFKAKTGAEAVRSCRENPGIDLVLMDINMPEMDGYEATRRIRVFNKEVVIIAQTGHALTGDREKSIAAGCNDSITKPINGIDLKKMISDCFPQIIKL